MHPPCAVKVDETFAPGFGRNVLSGLPVSVEISSDVIYNAIVDALHSIMDAIKVILERTPPELAADIIKDGVYVSGGTSQINNLEKFIKQETNLNVNIVDQPDGLTMDPSFEDMDRVFKAIDERLIFLIPTIFVVALAPS